MAPNTQKRLEIVEEKVETLEQVLSKYIRHSTKEMNQFRTEMQRAREKSDQEMKDFKKEMKDFKDEMKDFKDEMKDFKKESYKQWGDLANRLGTFAEDIAAPNIPAIAEKYFHLTNYISFTVRTNKYLSSDRSKFKEFDAIAVYPNAVILNETKSTVRNNYIDDFIDFLKKDLFFQYFPEYRGKKLIPIFAAMKFAENHLMYLSKNNIYAMAMTDGTMDLLNFDDVNP